MMILDFGKRRETPCGDCDDRGHCTMNCGPADAVFGAGNKAGFQGVPRSANPYHLDEEAAKRWDDGWAIGDREGRDAVIEKRRSGAR